MAEESVRKVDLQRWVNVVLDLSDEERRAREHPDHSEKLDALWDGRIELDRVARVTGYGREGLVVLCRDEYGMTLQQTGDVMGVSRERVRQLYGQAQHRSASMPDYMGALAFAKTVRMLSGCAEAIVADLRVG